MTPEDAARALAELFPPNPIRHGRLVMTYRGEDGRVMKDVTAPRSNGPASLELLQRHLTGRGSDFLALGYLPAIADAGGHLTNVGMLDLDFPKYAGFNHPAATLADDLEKLKEAALWNSLPLYLERSTSGDSWHAYVFADEAIPMSVMRDALKGLILAASLALPAGKVETFPAGDDANGVWYFIPYARALAAGHDRPGLGNTYIQTAYGEAIELADALEVIERCETAALQRLAEGYSAGQCQEPEDAEERKSETRPLPAEYFEPFKAALLNPPAGFERHSSIKAALNVFERMGRKRAGRTFIEDELLSLWAPDDSRDAGEWADEINRWAHAKNEHGRRYGLQHLADQGFKLPTVPPARVTTSPIPVPEPEQPTALPLKDAMSAALQASEEERHQAISEVWRSLLAEKATHLAIDAAMRELSQKSGITLGALRQDFKEAQKAATIRQPARKHAGEYAINNNVTCLVREQSSPSGDIETTYSPLANFHAEIIESTVQDDGVERVRHYMVRGMTRDGQELPPVTVAAREFDTFNWVGREWGTAAVVFAGLGHRDHMRAATLLLSQPSHTTLYTHTGWRQIAGQHVYLHGAGAIGRDDDLPDVQVELSGQLSHFVMPPRPSREEAAAALRSILGILELAPDRITAPLLSAVFRAPLGEADFIVHLAGRTGLGKSQLAALCQQASGAEMTSDRLPGSYTSTANSLERQASDAKDELLVIDDFNPTGSRSDVDKYHATFERLGRSAGNRAGRGRLRPDGTLRPTRVPRALILSTGEDLPRGHSLRARMLILELRPHDLDWQRLTDAQADASAGVYSTARAGFISWLAEDLPGHRQRLDEARKRERTALIHAAGHPRTADIGGQLLATWELMRAYAEGLPGFSRAELERVEARVRSGVLEAIQTQADHQAAADPVHHFLNLLGALIASGKGHLATQDGDYPGEGYGWRRQVTRDGDASYPQGVRLGWLAEGSVWLEPEVAFAEAQRLGEAQSEPIPMTKGTLWKRLAERRLLQPYTEPSSNKTRYTWKKTVEGRQRNVLLLASYALEEVGKVGIESVSADEDDESAFPTSPKTVGGRWETPEKVGNTAAGRGEGDSHFQEPSPTTEDASGKREGARNAGQDASAPTIPTNPTSGDIPTAHETQEESTSSEGEWTMNDLDAKVRARARRVPPEGAPL